MQERQRVQSSMSKEGRAEVHSGTRARGDELGEELRGKVMGETKTMCKRQRGGFQGVWEDLGGCRF